MAGSCEPYDPEPYKPLTKAATQALAMTIFAGSSKSGSTSERAAYRSWRLLDTCRNGLQQVVLGGMKSFASGEIPLHN